MRLHIVSPFFFAFSSTFALPTTFLPVNVEPFPIKGTTFTITDQHLGNPISDYEMQRTLWKAMNMLLHQKGGPSALAESEFAFPTEGKEPRPEGYPIRWYVRAERLSMTWEDYYNIAQGLYDYEHSFTSGAQEVSVFVEDSAQGGQVVAVSRLEKVVLVPGTGEVVNIADGANWTTLQQY